MTRARRGIDSTSIVLMVALGLFITIAAVSALVALSGCRSTATVASPRRTWTCDTHVEIRRSEPGACPICGRPLVPEDHNEPEPAIGKRAADRPSPTQPAPHPLEPPEQAAIGARGADARPGEPYPGPLQPPENTR